MQHAAGGALGLVAGMFLETILFITRSSIVENNAKAKARSKHMKKPAELCQYRSCLLKISAPLMFKQTLGFLLWVPESIMYEL
jgi:hypothetical protein